MSGEDPTPDQIMELIRKKAEEYKNNSHQTKVTRNIHFYDLAPLPDNEYVQTLLEKITDHPAEQGEINSYLALLRSGKCNRLETAALIIRNYQSSNSLTISFDGMAPDHSRRLADLVDSWIDDPILESLDFSRFGAVSDFLKYEGPHFVEVAYRVLLKRNADPSGMDFYTMRLRDGEMTKLEVLGRLRYGKEGLRAGVPIRQLLFPYLELRISRIPFIGFTIAFLISLFRKFSILSRLNRLEEDILRLERDWKENRNHLLTRNATNHDFAYRSLSDLHQRFAVMHSTVLALEKKNTTREPNISPSGERPAKLPDSFYYYQENEFRGSREEIRNRQSVYLPYIKETKVITHETPLVDLGCGRGEWLELLKESMIPSMGVDGNESMIETCRQLNLHAAHTDIIKFLMDQKDNSLGAITGFHIVEHFDPVIRLQILQECRRILIDGGLLILETPNPENLRVGAYWFYFDPDHNRPIPPDSLRVMLEYSGFHVDKILRLHPIEDIDPGNPPLKELFNGALDYGVLAIKR